MLRYEQRLSRHDSDTIISRIRCHEQSQSRNTRSENVDFPTIPDLTNPSRPNQSILDLNRRSWVRSPSSPPQRHVKGRGAEPVFGTWDNARRFHGYSDCLRLRCRGLPRPERKQDAITHSSKEKHYEREDGRGCDF